MLRIPNPVSDPEVFVRVYCELFASLREAGDFGLDDITAAMISRGNVTSQGALGEEALRRSTRADRSRDPLYNQSKMYAELFRALGWLHSTTSTLQFRFTPLGGRIPHLRTQRSLVRECLLGMVFPTEVMAVQNSQSIRPFGCILRTMRALRTLTRDELIAGPMSIEDDTDEAAFGAMVARLQMCRKRPGKLDAWLNDIANQRGISRSPTMENYTRFPLGVLARSGWCTKTRGQLSITQEGDLAAESLESSADWRLSEFSSLNRDVQAPLARWAYWSMLDRAGVDVSAYRIQMGADAQTLDTAGVCGAGSIYFSPFQQLSFRSLSDLVPELLGDMRSAPKASSVSISESPVVETRRVAEYHNLDPKFTPIAGDTRVSKLSTDLGRHLARLGTSEAVADYVHSCHAAANRDEFYPFVGDLLCALGLDCRVSRGGQNYSRADAIIIDRTASIPIEIKSPGEESEVSVKAIRQALENKIILLSRSSFPTTADAASLVIGYNPPNERSDVHELIRDIKATFGIRIGVLDIKTLVRIAVNSVSRRQRLDVSTFSTMLGVGRTS